MLPLGLKQHVLDLVLASTCTSGRKEGALGYDILLDLVCFSEIGGLGGQNHVVQLVLVSPMQPHLSTTVNVGMWTSAVEYTTIVCERS